MEENNQKNDSSQASDFDFLQEKIKERPIDKKKLLQRTIVTASLALLFGLVACLTFLLLEPVLNNWLYPEEEPGVVMFPQEQDEMLPEDMLTEGEMSTALPEDERYTTEEEIQTKVEEAATQQSKAEEEPQTQESQEQVTEEYLVTYQTFADNMQKLYQKVATSMVTVTGVKADVDWINNEYLSKGQIAGVIIANNNKELLILTKKTPLDGADSIQVTFSNHAVAAAVVKEYDVTTDLVVIAVDLKYLQNNVLEEISVATLGSSSASDLTGSLVIAIGNIQGYNDNMCYGMATSTGNIVTLADSQYKMITTDIYGSQNPTGILVNLQGQVVGIIDNTYNNSDTKNLLSAIGITELKAMITKISNGTSNPYVGIYAQDISAEVRLSQGLPQGAYVSNIDMDSPAMLNGIQKGDIIVAVNDKEIRNASDYMNAIRSSAVNSEISMVIRRASQAEYEEMTLQVQITSLSSK